MAKPGLLLSCVRAVRAHDVLTRAFASLLFMARLNVSEKHCPHGNHSQPPVLRRCALALLAASIWATPTLSNDAVEARRSVILIIGDGFDDQHVTLGRNYLKGMAGRLLLDDMPFRGAVQVETVSEAGAPIYTADSANTATTLATGVVTSTGRVGTDASDQDIDTLLERAAAAGYATGIVTSASITDATPASFMAHVSHRGCENPDIILGGTRYGMPFSGCPQDAVINGGPGSIAEQIIDAPVDIALGGGQKHFATSVVGAVDSLKERAVGNGITVITDTESIQPLDSEKRVLGLFASSHLPVRLQGKDGRIAEASGPHQDGAQEPRATQVVEPEPMVCEPNPAFGTTPTLATLTQVALDQLAERSSRGFFLMIESASIDKQSHARNPCGSIGEIEQLEEALAAALAFAGDNPQTLVLVTADHAQAAQIIPDPNPYLERSPPGYSPGTIARVLTPEGGIMRINYATTTYRSAQHTGANVPLFANALGRDWLGTFMRQREVHDAMAAFLGLDQP